MKKILFIASCLLVWMSSNVLAQHAVKDLPLVTMIKETHGQAGLLAKRMSFCTFADPLSFKSSLNQLAANATGSTWIAWSLDEWPMQLKKHVAITDFPAASHAAGCIQVEKLPPGGVDDIQLHVPYALVDHAVDWSVGFTALVMAIINDDMPREHYIPRLKRHVNLVTQLFESKGMDGYVVYAGADFEWAYLHWKDEETAKKAFATPDGATGPMDSRSIQRPLGRKLISLN
jgi:hypothetical protein